MRESTINEQVNAELNDFSDPVGPYPNDNEVEKKGLQIDLSVLKTPTGAGSVEDYVHHTLNFNKSMGLARIIRGFTGFAGQDLNLAIIDIFLGIFELTSKKKGLFKSNANGGISPN